MVSLSKAVEEAMWGDDALLKQLDLLEKLFLAGNRAVLWEAIDFCGHHQLVMPDWLRDANADITQKLRAGEFGTFDEAFGVKLESKATRKKNTRLRQRRSDVLRLLQAHRLAGGNFNAEEAFEAVGDELGISRRDVEAIYKEHGKFLATLPRGNPEGSNHAIGDITIVIPKRHGRSIVKDSED